MNNCKCGRELRDGEIECPACVSKKSFEWKKIIEGAGAVALVLGGILLHIITGGKGGKS